MQSLSLSIAGMTCGHCVVAVREALLAIPGVELPDVQIGRARVAADDTVAPATLVAAVEAAGYGATLDESGADAPGPALTPLRSRGAR